MLKKKQQQQFLTKTIGTFDTKEIGKRFSRFFNLFVVPVQLLFIIIHIYIWGGVSPQCVWRGESADSRRLFYKNIQT